MPLKRGTNRPAKVNHGVRPMAEKDVNTQTFINTIFPPEQLRPDETVLVGYPATFVNDQGKTKRYHKHFCWTPRIARQVERGKNGWLYCVSTVRRPAEGERVHARLADVCTTWVMVLDDIGTKARRPPVVPSYILETSPGNYQYGYLLDPLSADDPVNPLRFDACLKGLAAAGFNDAGCRSASRKVKLPGAIHSTGFVSRIVRWAPELSWDLDELMGEMGVKPAARRAVRKADPDFHGVAFAAISDNILDWLTEQGLMNGGGNDTWLYMACPWRAEHGDDEPDGSATAYSPHQFGTAARAWHCRHGHCTERTTKMFLTWVAQQGGPRPATTQAVTTPSALDAIFAPRTT